jgi:hypothetical protein
MPVQASSLGTLEEANEFFSNRLHRNVWEAALDDDKQAALNEATELISMFDFIGTKTDSDQFLPFPRMGIVNIDSTTIPEQIKIANFLIAYEILDGWDFNREEARVLSRGFSSVRITYDPNVMPEFLGSKLAWLYLKAFLSTAGGINLHRVS